MAMKKADLYVAIGSTLYHITGIDRGKTANGWAQVKVDGRRTPIDVGESDIAKTPLSAFNKEKRNYLNYAPSDKYLSEYTKLLKKIEQLEAEKEAEVEHRQSGVTWKTGAHNHLVCRKGKWYLHTLRIDPQGEGDLRVLPVSKKVAKALLEGGMETGS